MADKDFKTAVLKMLKELQEDGKKVNKISEQNGSNRDRKPKKILQM